MGSEAETEANFNLTPKLKLPFFSVPPTQSPVPTPPHQSSASVPFSWEEQPGKPKPCTALARTDGTPAPKCLDLPPRLLILSGAKTTTPTSAAFHGRSVFQSASFRFFARREGICSPGKGRRERGPIGCGGKRVGGEDSCSEETEKMEKMRRSKSFQGVSSSSSSSSPSRSEFFWTSLYEGFKQVVPWKSRKFKKERWSA